MLSHALRRFCLWIEEESSYQLLLLLPLLDGAMVVVQ
jgi:hypothetical protein